MRIEEVVEIQTDVASAYRRALAECEPLALPVRVYADDRGWSIMNQLQGILSTEGQINYSVTYPAVIKAWHRHALQTDFWLCLTGHLKAGIHREDGRTWRTILGDRRPAVLIIPPTLWHGAGTVGREPAGLLYYVTRAYNSQQPDEERRAFDSVPGFAWSVEHR